MARVGIIGATGAVGRRLVSELEMLADKVDAVSLFASKRSAGQTISFCGESLPVREFSLQSAQGLDCVLMSAGGDFSRNFATKLVSQGSVVIDNSSAWRMDRNVHLIVPEVNGELVKGDLTPRIIANPNCSTIQLVLSTAPLIHKFGVEALFVSSYQSVSGSGQAGIDDLIDQTKQRLNQRTPSPRYLPKAMAFDLIPAIDTLDESGFCFEEVKIINETKKILDLRNLTIHATTIRVPTLIGHGESVTLQMKQEITVQEAIAEWRKHSCLRICESTNYDDLPSLASCENSREVIVTRPRGQYGEVKSNCFSFWNMADNLMVGAATNAVKILQKMLPT